LARCVRQRYYFQVTKSIPFSTRISRHATLTLNLRSGIQINRFSSTALKHANYTSRLDIRTTVLPASTKSTFWKGFEFALLQHQLYQASAESPGWLRIADTYITSRFINSPLHSFSILSYDRPIDSFKASSSQSAKWRYHFQFTVSFLFLKVIQ